MLESLHKLSGSAICGKPERPAYIVIPYKQAEPYPTVVLLRDQIFGARLIESRGIVALF
jgi:hypothetical protein